MLYIDIRTFVVASAVSALAMAFALYVSARSFVGAIPGMRRWAGSCAIQSVGWLLLATQEFLPDSLSMVAANGLILASIALSYQALCEFTARPYRRRLPLAGVALTTAAVAGFTFGVPSLLGRTLAVCAGNTALFFLCGLVILRQDSGPVFSSARWTGGGFVLCGLGGIVRAAAVIMAPPSVSVFAAPGAGQVLATIAMFMGVVAIPCGFLLMCIERCLAELRRLANMDVLTGSLNRGMADRRLAQEWRTAVQHLTPLSVVLFDVDYFKQINDTYGHLAGDQVLCHIADRMRQQLRAGDSVGRYGGEEFIVVLPDTPLERALQVAERICRQIEVDPLVRAELSIRCTLSAGVAAVVAADPTPDALLQRADTALYSAKRQGRNRVCTAPLPAA